MRTLTPSPIRNETLRGEPDRPPVEPRGRWRDAAAAGGVVLVALAFVFLAGVDGLIDEWLSENASDLGVLRFLVDLVFVSVAAFVVLRWRAVRTELAERRRTEEALRESEERFSTLAGATTEAVALHDKGQILEVNDVFCRMFRLDREGVVGHSALEFVPPEFKDFLIDRIRNPRDEPYEIVALRADGTRFPAQVASRSAPFQGRTVRVTAIRDLTEEKKAAADLREAEELYRSLVEQIPAVTYIDEIDASTESGVRSLYMSPQVEQLLGYAPEDFRADPDLWAKVLHPADRDQALRADRALYQTGRSSGHEYRLVARDGRVVWVFDHGSVLPSVSGRPRLIQGVLVDITDRKRTEEALRLREGVLAAIAAMAERLLSAPWETVIEEALADLGAATGASRVWIFDAEKDEGGETLISRRFEWVALGIEPQIDNPALQAFSFRASGFEDWANTLFAGGIINAHTRELSPQQAAFLAEESILSILNVPVFAGDAVWGLMGFDDCVAEREWTPAEIDALKAAASTLGAAVARQRAERALAGAEAKYRELVENVPAVVYNEALDPTPEFFYMSPQVESLLGFAPERFLDLDFWQSRIHPDDRERVRLEDERSNRTHEPFRCEYRMLSADGREVWIGDEAVLMSGTEGRPPFWRGVWTDVTERKAAERAVLEAEARYRTLVEQIPAVLYLDRPDKSMETIYVSPQVEAILGLSPEDWMGDPLLWEKHIHPEDRTRVLETYSVFLETGELGAESLEYRMIRPEGRVVWVNERTSLVRDEDGTPLAFQGVMFDVTERKRAEEGLREAEQRFRTLVEQIPAVTYVWNSVRDPGEGDFSYISPRVERMLGFPVEQWLSEPDLWRRCVEQSDYERVRGAWEEASRAGRPFDMEYRMIARDGATVWVHDQASIFEGGEAEGPRLWQGVFFDVTDRKRSERERQLLLARLVQAQEEERRRIAADIHDDPVQKMTAVGLRLEAVRKRVADPETRERLGTLDETVRLAIQHLRHLLFELRPPALDKEGLAAALGQYLDEVRPEAEFDTSLVNRLVEEPPIEVRTLAYRIAQEAITNARKHSAAHRLELTLEPRSGGVYVRVEDDGKGLPGEVGEDARGHLGMLTMRERAELAGGWLRVTSRQGRGTAVEFWLPLAA